MERRFKFTKTKLASLPPAPTGKRVQYYDEKVPGFCVMVTDKGNKSYYLYKKVKGIAERIFIAKVSGIPLEEARNQAAELVGQIAKGVNPQESRRSQQGEVTLHDLFDEFKERHLLPYRRQKTVQEYDRQFQVYLKRWHKRKLSALNQRDIQALHGQIGKDHGHYLANRVLALLKVMFNKAKAWGLYTGDNPAVGVERFSERSRERFLHGEELQRFVMALNEESNTTARDCLWLCLLTGARRSNVQAMAWKDISFERAEWRIPDTKNRKPHTVPLTGRAMEIVAQRYKNKEHPTWVFPGSGQSGHIVELKSVWARLLKRAEIDDLRIHDLRRTIGSWQAMTGASILVIGKSLNQTTSSATEVYSRVTPDPVRESLERAQAAMFEVDEQHVPLRPGERVKK